MLGTVFILLGLAGTVAGAVRVTHRKNLAKHLYNEDVYYDGISNRDVVTGKYAIRTKVSNGYFVCGYDSSAKYSTQDYIDMGGYKDENGKWHNRVYPNDEILGTNGHNGMGHGQGGWIIRNLSGERRIYLRRLYRDIENELLENAKENAIRDGKTVYLSKIDWTMYDHFKEGFPLADIGNEYTDLKTGRRVVKRVIQDEYFCRKKIHFDDIYYNPEAKKYNDKLFKGYKDGTIERPVRNIFCNVSGPTRAERDYQAIMKLDENPVIGKWDRGNEMDGSIKETFLDYTEATVVYMDAETGKYLRLADECVARNNDYDRKVQAYLHNRADDPRLAQSQTYYEKIVKDEITGKHCLMDSLDLYEFDMSDRYILTRHAEPNYDIELDIKEHLEKEYEAIIGSIYVGNIILKDDLRIKHMNEALRNEVKGDVVNE